MTNQEVISYIINQRINSKNELKIGLIGPLGVGKTDLVKKLLSAISNELGRLVHSPTFNLCNIYSTEGVEVYHFDLYRIDSEEELYHIEFWEYLEDKDAFVLIEWADIFSDVCRNCDLVFSIREELNGERIYSIVGDKK